MRLASSLLDRQRDRGSSHLSQQHGSLPSDNTEHSATACSQCDDDVAPADTADTEAPRHSEYHDTANADTQSPQDAPMTDVVVHSEEDNSHASPSVQSQDFHCDTRSSSDQSVPDYLSSASSLSDRDDQYSPDAVAELNITENQNGSGINNLPPGNQQQQVGDDQDMSDDDGGAPLDQGTADILDSNHPPTGSPFVQAADNEDEETPVAPAIDLHNLAYFHPFYLSGAQVVDWIMEAGLAPQPSGETATPDLAQEPDITGQAHDTEQQPAPTVPQLTPPPLSNPNPAVLGSLNLGLIDFLSTWAQQARFRPSRRSYPPHLSEVKRQSDAKIHQVQYHELQGDQNDIQGLDWDAMETTRNAARVQRRLSYANYVNRHGSDRWPSQTDDFTIESTESFFRFRRLNVRQDVRLIHFQLRSVLACSPLSHAFYPGPRGINRMNIASRKMDVAINLRDSPTTGSAVSTLDSNCGILMGGTFSGAYCLKSLGAWDKKEFSEGQISNVSAGITNHIRVHTPRGSGGPVASISSNDNSFRVMDLTTEKITSHVRYPYALNCSAVSPDRRLRVIVGDSFNVLITDADTGEVLQELSGHRDYSFACDWSDDGWTVATGCQDKGIKIWDARKWRNSSGVSTPLSTLRAEMAGVRNLRFSPIGTGRKVLVAAEEADFINIIDAQTFDYKQTIDVFGEIGGVDFNDDAQTLNVLCCDPHRGGLLQFDRCGRGPEPIVEEYKSARSWPYRQPMDEKPTRKYGRRPKPQIPAAYTSPPF